MQNLYKKRTANKNWYKTILLGFLFLALDLTSAAQGKKQNTQENKKRKPGVASEALRKNGGLSQQTTRRKGTSKARNSQEFYWKDNAWAPYINHVYSYDADGRLVEEIETNPATGENAFRSTYTYDSRGNETEYVYYNWEDGKWVIKGGSRSSYTYANNRLMEIVGQNFRDGAWVNSFRDTYAYNAAGAPIEYREDDWENGDWEAAETTFFNYTDGSSRPTSVVEQERDGNSWINAEREIDLVWDNTGNADPLDWQKWRLINHTNQVWEEGTWVNDYKVSTTLQANGGYLDIEQVWVNNGWVNDYRWREDMDEHGALTLDQGEKWQNNQWEIVYGEKSTHTYNATGDLTETIQQNFNTTSNTYQNEARWVYSNFQTILAAKEELQALLQVYPNPTVGQLSVKLEKGAGASVKVVSLAGQTMLSTSLSATNEQELNLAGLPAGTYILQIQSKAGVRTQKIVKL